MSDPLDSEAIGVPIVSYLLVLKFESTFFPSRALSTRLTLTETADDLGALDGCIG